MEVTFVIERLSPEGLPSYYEWAPAGGYLYASLRFATRFYNRPHAEAVRRDLDPMGGRLVIRELLDASVVPSAAQFRAEACVDAEHGQESASLRKEEDHAENP